MNLFESLNKYFNFNRRERNGIVFLLLFIFALLLIKILLVNYRPDSAIHIQYINLLTDSIQKNGHHSVKTELNEATENNTTTYAEKLFTFNPNTITKEEALVLGFPNKLATTLINYRNKGGKFYHKEDLKKLYGFNENLYDKLKDYIVIPSETKAEKFNATHLHSKEINLTIELNTADSLQLVQLKGIGPVFSKRILKFRDALGGFYNKQQLLEVYGMKDSLYAIFEKHVIVNESLIKKINLNKANVEELNKHPYINRNMAKAIINFRAKHGFYKGAEDLLKTGVINQEKINQLLPYLNFE